MSDKPGLKIVKIDQENCVNYSAREILQMAIDDIDQGRASSQRIIIYMDNDRYYGGFRSGYEIAGFAAVKMALETNG